MTPEIVVNTNEEYKRTGKVFKTLEEVWREDRKLTFKLFGITVITGLVLGSFMVYWFATHLPKHVPVITCPCCKAEINLTTNGYEKPAKETKP